MDLKYIRLPEKHVLAIKKLVDDETGLPTGFIYPSDKGTEYGRKSIKNRVGRDALDVREIENTPFVGFKIYGNFWIGAKNYWLIEDPRGYAVPVSSEYLSTLMLEATIEKGEIQDKCIWLYCYGTSFLAIENGKFHTLALENEKRYSASIKVKDLIIGHKYLAKDSKERIYLGQYYYMGYPIVDTYRDPDALFAVSNRKTHFFLEDNGIITPNLSPKMSFVVSTDNGIPSDVKQFIKTKDSFFIELFDQKFDLDKTELTLDEIPEKEAIKRKRTRLVVKLDNGRYSYVRPEYIVNRVKKSNWTFKEIDLTETLKTKSLVRRKKSYTGAVQAYYQLKIKYNNQVYTY